MSETSVSTTWQFSWVMRSRKFCRYSMILRAAIQSHFSLAEAKNLRRMDTWSVCESLTPVLSNLAQDPDVLSDDDFAVIEQFVVYLYDRGNDDLIVNAARKNLFFRKGRTIENIPPTQAALLQHLLRSMYQANCWQQMCVKLQKLLNPGTFEWECIDEKWTPLWTKLPKVADSSRILVKCGCKKGYKETVNAGRQYWIGLLYVTVAKAVIRIQNVNPFIRLEYIVGYFTRDIFLHIYMQWL